MTAVLWPSTLDAGPIFDRLDRITGSADYGNDVVAWLCRGYVHEHEHGEAHEMAALAAGLLVVADEEPHDEIAKALLDLALAFAQAWHTEQLVRRTPMPDDVSEAQEGPSEPPGALGEE